MDLIIEETISETKRISYRSFYRQFFSFDGSTCMGRDVMFMQLKVYNVHCTFSWNKLKCIPETDQCLRWSVDEDAGANPWLNGFRLEPTLIAL